MLVPLAAHSLLEIILVRSIANKINKAVTMNRFFLILTLSILASSALTLPTLAAAPKYKADYLMPMNKPTALPLVNMEARD